MLLFVIYQKFYVPLRERARLMNQGVVYLKRPFLDEIATFRKAVRTNPYEPTLTSIATELESINNGRMPGLNGLCMPGRVWVSVNSVDYLDDIYVKANAYNTKLTMETNIFAIMANRNIVFMDTFDKDYTATRKELAGAFFKNKLQTITKIIKEEVVEIIAEY